MPPLRVGERHHPDKGAWAEITEYNHRGGAHDLVLRVRRPTDAEVAAVARGPADFGVLDPGDGDLLFVLYRFGAAVGWSDVPFSPHLLPAAERTPPPDPEPGADRALLAVVLVDAADGIVRALRAVALPPDVTAALHAGIVRLLSRPWPGRAAYDRDLRAFYAANPTPAGLAARAVAGRGGE